MSRHLPAIVATVLVTAACGQDDPGARMHPPDHSLARAIAARQAARVPPASLAWNWEEAVLAAGLCALDAATAGAPGPGDEAPLAYVRAWMDRHISGGYAIETSDTAAPATAAIYLLGRTGDARYRDVIQRFLRYVREEALRTPEGALNHLGTTEAVVTAWVDSLWMVVVPLARFGVEGPDPASLDEAGVQHRVFATLLQDENGLFRHAHAWPVPQDEGVYWGRGNGWVLAAQAEYLSALRAAGREDPEVLGSFRRLVAAVTAAQDPATGLWWTVLNRPGETYLETSASALFAYGLALGWRSGLLSDEVLPVVARAMEGVRSRVVPGPDGPVVTGTSGPTTAGSFEQYASVKVRDDLAYGVGAVLLALTETAGLPLE